MATDSEENGRHPGLNWIPGRVVRLEASEGYRVPHVGWNEITHTRNSTLFSQSSTKSNFYFDHSFHYRCDPEYISAQCNYGVLVTAAIQKDLIYGVQFHPEKSQNNGLKIFRAFFNAVAKC